MVDDKEELNTEQGDASHAGADADGPLKLDGLGGGEDILGLVSQIGQALSEAGEDDAVADDNAFEFPLYDALDMLPKRYLKNADRDIEGESIVLVVDDLFDQLSLGKVEISISQLAYHIPINMVYHAVFDDKELVKLPLPTVVTSVGMSTLKEHTPKKMREYDIEGMDDPFTESELMVTEGHDGVLLEDEDAGLIIDDEETETAEPEAEEPSAVEAPPMVKDLKDMGEEEAEEAEVTVVGGGFAYPVAVALDNLPEGYVVEGAVGKAGDTTVTVDLEDLYGQLRQGKVSIMTGTLAELLPADYLTDQARSDAEGTTNLDLKSVVGSVGLDALKEKTPDKIREYDIERMADPFTEPDVLPKFEKAPKQAKPAKAEAPETPVLRREAVVEAESPAEAKVVPYQSSFDPEAELKYHEFPGNVNLNAATLDELLLLNGMTPRIAEEIIKHREKNQGFKSVFELAGLPGVTRRIFRKITGMKMEQKRYHRRRRLAGYLKIQADQVTNLALVSERLASKSGFSGCIISDPEGLILAQSGCEEMGEAISAVVPRIVRQLRENMDLIGAGAVDIVSISINGILYTIAAVENVALTAIHEESRISKTELAFVRKVSKELSWLLSLRGYVGPVVG